MIESDRLERTLELARTELEPSGSDWARSRAALGLPPRPPALLGAPHASSAPSAPSASNAVSSWQALRASGKAGLLVGVLLAGTNFAVGYWLGLREDTRRAHASAFSKGEPAPAAAALRAPFVATDSIEVKPAPAPPSAAVSAGREAPGVAVHAPPAAARKRPAKPVLATAAANDELSLLRRVERALRAENPALALALLAELDERFPNTELAEERRAATVLAQCGAAGPGAQLRAQNFLRERPASVYAERIRAACGLAGAPGHTTAAAPEAAGVEGSAAAGHE